MQQVIDKTSSRRKHQIAYNAEKMFHRYLLPKNKIQMIRVKKKHSPIRMIFVKSLWNFAIKLQKWNISF